MGKSEDILERQSLVFIQYSSSYSGICEGNRENAQTSSRMTPMASGKFPVPKRVSGKVSQR